MSKEIKSFRLHIPLIFHKVHQIEENSFTIDDKEYKIEKSLESDSNRYLKVSSFSTKEEAHEFIQKLHGALLFMAVKKTLSLQGDFNLNEPIIFDESYDLSKNVNFKHLYDKPVIVRGHYHTSEATILPIGVPIQGSGGGGVQWEQKISVKNFKEWLEDGYDLKQPEKIIKNEKLKLAIELYASSFYDTGRRAKIINYVTVLEALLENEKEGEAIRSTIDDLKEKLNEVLPKPRDEGVQEIYKYVCNELGRMKKKSISAKFRDIILSESETIKDKFGMSDEELQDIIKTIYAVRSRLLHTGKADNEDVREVLSKIGKIVHVVLEQHILRAANH